MDPYKTMTEIKKRELTPSDQLRLQLAGEYLKQITNYFNGDKDKAMRFVSSIIQSARKIPKLYQCERTSLLNAFMTMAQLGLMPSDVSGEAYVIPYDNNRKVGDKWEKITEAQFQLGYQGLVTLFYRSGAKEIVAEIVYEKDDFSYKNGIIEHNPDVFSEDRGKAKGAYVIVKLGTGGSVHKVMSKKEILDIAQKFSKSFGGKHTPWDEANDPQLWMWKKTVLKQCAKLVPKNEIIAQAIAEDNKDSIIADRLEAAKKDSEGLAMGNLLKHGEENQKKAGSEDQSANGATDAEGPQDRPAVDGEVIDIGK